MLENAQQRSTTKRGRGLVRAVAAAVVALTVSVAVLATTATPAAAGCVTTAGLHGESEGRFVQRLNDLRRSKGLGTLVVNPTIADQSRSWSAVMGAQDWLHHARDTGAGDGVEPHQDYVTLISQAVPDWSRAAENVGVNTMRTFCTLDEARASIQGATDSLHTAFVNSSGHYANMVGDFNQVGIGVHFVGSKLWVTVRFARGTLPKIAPTFSSAQLATAGEYVDAVYQLFLGRAATSSDVSHWSPVVASGDRTRLTNALAVSNEWAGSRVNELYRTILGREADAAGRAAWVRAIAGGMRLEDVAAGFYGSQERFNAEGQSIVEYVRGLYEDILTRPADAGGLGYWVDQIRRGVSRTRVAAGFYGSIESRTTRVQDLYQEILGRTADAGGQAHWVGKLATLGDVKLASFLAASNEYWLKATR